MITLFGVEFAVFGGLLAAGVAVASHRVLQALAGFLVISLGRAFRPGDHIEIGGVRGEVIEIGLLGTTLALPGAPVRMATVANSKAFEKPVFNYSRDFDFVWDEIVLPIRYGTDLRLAEHIVLDAARAATGDLAPAAAEQLAKLERKHLLGAVELEPRAYLRLTESWIELSLCFIARPWGVREMKDRVSRRVLSGLQGAGIEIASSTVEVVGLPTLPVRLEGMPPDEEEEAKPSDFQ